MITDILDLTQLLTLKTKLKTLHVLCTTLLLFNIVWNCGLIFKRKLSLNLLLFYLPNYNVITYTSYYNRL